MGNCYSSDFKWVISTYAHIVPVHSNFLIKGIPKFLTWNSLPVMKKTRKWLFFQVPFNVCSLNVINSLCPSLRQVIWCPEPAWCEKKLETGQCAGSWSVYVTSHWQNRIIPSLCGGVIAARWLLWHSCCGQWVAVLCSLSTPVFLSDLSLQQQPVVPVHPLHPAVVLP